MKTYVEQIEATLLAIEQKWATIIKIKSTDICDNADNPELSICKGQIDIAPFDRISLSDGQVRFTFGMMAAVGMALPLSEMDTRFVHSAAALADKFVKELGIGSGKTELDEARDKAISLLEDYDSCSRCVCETEFAEVLRKVLRLTN